MAAGYLFVMGRCFYYTNAKHLVCFLVGEQSVKEVSSSSKLAGNDSFPERQMTPES
jgi:hypothetical protein